MNTLGKLTFKYRKPILMIWSLLFVLSGIFALKLPSVLSGSGFEYEGSYKEVEKVMDEDFNIPASSLILLFEKSDEAAEEDFKSYIENTMTRITKVKNVEIQQSSPQIKDNKAFAVLSFNNKDQMPKSIESVRDKLEDEDSFSVGLTGRAVIEEDMNQAAQEDLVRAELIGIPIALIVLLLAFRGVIAALIPLITGFVSVVVAMGMLYFTGQKLDLSIFVLNTAPMIGLALGIDFALLFVNRFREELNIKATDEAIVKTVATSGRAILFSGFCVLLGLIGMLFIQVGVFQSVALGGIAVVFTSVLAANTFLPAFLSIMGPHINKWMILKETKGKESSWHSFARFVMKRTVVMTLAATLLLIIGMIPVGGMKLAIPESDALPTSYESRTAFEKYKETFGDIDQTIAYIVASSNVNMVDSLQKLENVINDIQSDPLVSEVDSIFSATNMSANKLIAAKEIPELKSQLAPAFERLTNKNEAILQVKLNAKNSSNKAKKWVREWEKKELDLALKIGGESKFHQEIFDEIMDKVVYSLAFILLSTYIVLFFAFRSVLIPLKAILMNVISLGCTFGIIVWLFQEGHLGFHASDIALMIPVFAFSIVFGLSMDYEVFLISRIYEIYLETGNNDKATLEGLTSTSKIITSAAAIMIVITGAFGFTGIIPVQQMGVTVALAIFIDATIVRMVLVPSLMKLLGDVNWWSPFHKQRRVRQYG
ncbi:MMPL family transporter [Bacillus sp. FJAT-49711]|uniref:MMPL family transporter n=1 Tax=Bacillus sp. FJAT-49711 TaxID=2833585 RepID=UPI001BC97BC8|nr:MMPL family transporter [Bacillus sp. FJAT-49711]MBS4219521.1 MMPL family transporter [Bacillus sp. FJAT-49711]